MYLTAIVKNRSAYAYAQWKDYKYDARNPCRDDDETSE